MFMTQDTSPNYTETYAFLRRRLTQLQQWEGAKSDLSAMLNFGAQSFIGLLGTVSGLYPPSNSLHLTRCLHFPK